MNMPGAGGDHLDLGAYVRASATRGVLVVQPRMGMPEPTRMRAGLAAVAAAADRTVGTLTLDSYTRVGDSAGARRALANNEPLNGYPILAHSVEATVDVVAAVRGLVPTQVRHGTARPGPIFRRLVAAGLSATEGGPVSYCLPYGRTPLAESVACWRDAAGWLVRECRRQGRRAHLETFGGCLLGQLCPPSMLIAVSVLEALFFVQNGAESVSLSYAQQTDPVQDIEALVALRELATRHLPSGVDRHIVLYTYMGLHPRTVSGARRLLEDSVDIAVRGGAHRLLVKTAAEADRIPTIEENVAALTEASARARVAATQSRLPRADQVDFGDILAESAALIDAVLELDPDVGRAMRRAFATGRLDVPFCLHQDNRGLARGGVDADGRLRWTDVGRLPLPATSRRARSITAGDLRSMLRQVADRYDECGGCRPRVARPAGREGTPDGVVRL